MKKSFNCPFCNSTFALTKDTYSFEILNFDKTFTGHKPLTFKTLDVDPITVNGETVYENKPTQFTSDTLSVLFFKCPQCGKTTIRVEFLGDQYKIKTPFNVFPSTLANQYPDYVPQAIREDYEEAYKILTLSPKASATLSRRCIQGMIRDIYKVNESNLYKEIQAIEDQVTPDLWEAIDSIRKIGNIGAHMEKDINFIIPIDPDEAKILINLVEILIQDWYITPYKRQEKINNVINLSKEKNQVKNSK